jgi:hypothetical protein
MELIRIALDNPVMAAEATGFADSANFIKTMFINWHFSYYAMTYEMKDLSKSALQIHARSLFNVEYTRNWWAGVRESRLPPGLAAMG